MKIHTMRIRKKINFKKKFNFKKNLKINIKKYFLVLSLILLIYFLIYLLIIGFNLFKKIYTNKNSQAFYLENIEGEYDYIPKNHSKQNNEEIIATFKNIDNFNTFDSLQKYIYTIDKTAFVDESDINIEELLNYDLKVNLKKNEPKILIFHTHSQEEFIDSESGNIDDTIVGVGLKLAKILAEKYGINVVHDKGFYDISDGKVSRGNSYETMEASVKKILEKYPSIEVIIDLHRDGVDGDKKFVTEIDNKQTAKIMFFNGVSKLNLDGNAKILTEFSNPYIKENLSFSLNMFLTANELYPGLARHNYIKPYRYSLHLLPKSLLVEIGANTNTVEEAKNAMYPLAEILVKVIN